jgi:tripartite-type tricarboxylate transporter receptor subunit TctC
MTIPRRQFLQMFASATVLSALPRFAMALDYPTRPVRIVLGLPVGTGPDILVRLASQSLAERLGPRFIVENRPGAGGNIGAEAVVRAPADGYTLLAFVPSITVNAALYTALSFNFASDIVPVAYIGASPFVMVVTPSLPVKTLPEFIAYSRANPGKINMASQGVGTAPHLCGELFRLMTGVELTHVPYHQNLVPDLVSGKVQLYFSPLPQPIAAVRAGQLRALGVTTTTRSALLPDVPAIAEFVSGYEASGWVGIGAPKGVPLEIADKLNNEVNAVVVEGRLKARLESMGVETRSMTRGEFDGFIVAETKKWGQVIKALGIRLD